MKKALALILAFLMLVGTLCACQSQAQTGNDTQSPSENSTPGNEDTPTITLTWFDKNTGEAFTDPVAEVIKEKAGINIEIQQPTGDPNEKLVLVMTGVRCPTWSMDRRRRHRQPVH